jgi:hypothetical protein
MATFPPQTQIFTGDLMAFWDIRYTINLLTLTLMLTLVLTSTQQLALFSTLGAQGQSSLQLGLGQEFLKVTFRQNGYRHIWRALNPFERVAPPSDNPDSVTFLCYVGLTFNHTGRVLSQHNISWLTSHQGKSLASFSQSRVT